MKESKSIRPPRLADKLFEKCCGNAMVEDLLGDMHEIFYSNLQHMPARKAKLKYWTHVFALITSYAIKKRKRNASYHPFSQTNNLAMLKNYFKVAVRNLARQKFFTIINVTGLAVGMSIALLLLAMLAYVYRYDNFQANRERIYRVVTHAITPEREGDYASAPAPLADELKHGFTGIEKTVRINSTFNGEFTYNNNRMPLNGYFVDPEFFQVFTYSLAKGNVHTALQKPYTVAITQSAARKIFNDDDPIGKMIELDDKGEFEVTAVLNDPPKNSHLQFELLTSYGTLEKLYESTKVTNDQSWATFRDSYIYLLLPRQHDTESVNTFLDKVAPKKYKKDDAIRATFQLQAMTDITPGPEFFNDIGPEFGYTTFLIFAVLTLLILLPACFNYVNISIARTLKRAKEIGLRKVIGGQSSQIFTQFVMETVVVTIVALAGAYGIFTLIRDEFLGMLVAESAQALDLKPDFITWIWFISFGVMVGLLTGAVPALYFARLNPIQALKHTASMKAMKGINFRKVLIVTQFALSLGFIMSVVVVIRQYRHTMNYNFGFSQENILDVELQNTDPQIFKNEYAKLSSVHSVSMSSSVVGTQYFSSSFISTGDQDSTEVFEMFVDENYLSNLNIPLLAGQGFSENAAENSTSVIVNEEFLKHFKIPTPSDAIGKVFTLTNGADVVVAGVVKNFHYTSLRDPINSFFFRYDQKQFHYANLKVTSSDMHATISEMETVWSSINKDRKFEAAFFSHEIEDAYSFYFSMIRICGFLGFLAIAISCLGLLGMVVYTTESRTKEVGIRKVMGASAGNVTILLSKSYVKLMLIAALIAIPITYFIMDKLMEQIQYYSTSIGLADVLISLAIIFVLGVATIMSQTVKASKANPVDTLRYE